MCTSLEGCLTVIQPTPDNTIFGTLNGLYSQLDTINATVRRLLSQREILFSTPEHIDDIIADFRKGTDEAAAIFEAQIASYAADPSSVDFAEMLGTGAAVYFIRDLITAKMPTIIRRVYPRADRGMRRDDRLARLADIDAKIDQSWKDRDDLRQRMVYEQFKLREARWEKPGQRSDIEHVLMDLGKALEAVRLDQDALHNRHSQQKPARAA